MKLKLTVCGGSHIGSRNENQDKYLIMGSCRPGINILTDCMSDETVIFDTEKEGEYLCIAVSDGMGGMKSGAKASETTLSFFASELALLGSRITETGSYVSGDSAMNIFAPKHVPADTVNAVEPAETVFDGLCREMSRRVEDDSGATLSVVLLYVRDKKPAAHVFNVGDSPIYLLRKNELSQIAVLDNYAEFLRRNGQSPIMIGDHIYGSNMLMNYIGNKSFKSVSPDGEYVNFAHISFFEPEVGDIIAAATDGLRQSSDDSIRAGMSDGRPAFRLIADAVSVSARSDNTTVVTLKIENAGNLSAPRPLVYRFFNPGDILPSSAEPAEGSGATKKSKKKRPEIKLPAPVKRAASRMRDRMPKRKKK